MLHLWSKNVSCGLQRHAQKNQNRLKYPQTRYELPPIENNRRSPDCRCIAKKVVSYYNYYLWDEKIINRMDIEFADFGPENTTLNRIRIVFDSL